MIKEKLKILTNHPGCYLMKNKDGLIIYVGKAKNLKNRLKSYFNSNHTGKTKALVDNIHDFEYIVTKSETEALILEINLIKKYNPKYNVIFKDDKTYPYIELTNEKYPRLILVRNPNRKKNNSHLFGPYPNVIAAKKIVNLLNRIYPLRKCSTFNKKICLYYHIGECLGYCYHNNDSKVNQIKEEIIKFLSGYEHNLVKKLEVDMYEASKKLHFEKASELKQLMDDIKTTLNKQNINLNDNIDRDVFNCYLDQGYISIQVLHLRGGKLVARDSVIYPIIEDEKEELTYYIGSFYEKNNVKPKEIMVPEIIDINLIEDLIGIKVINPKRGSKKHVLELAKKNAKIAHQEKVTMIKEGEEIKEKAWLELSKQLNINSLNRIEIFDNSHLFGNFSVSGMVVFENGKPNKKQYRKYKITSEYKDDYHLMEEVIYRRYFRVIKDNLLKPDLIIVDGGSQQINAALNVLEQLKLNIPVCGLKKDEKHKVKALVYNNQTIIFAKYSPVFHLFERISNEVHRWTIKYHQDIRSNSSLKSILDNVKGIGEKRKIELLKKFGSINNLKKASVEDLKIILPTNIALDLKAFLEER